MALAAIATVDNSAGERILRLTSDSRRSRGHAWPWPIDAH